VFDRLEHETVAAVRPPPGLAEPALADLAVPLLRTLLRDLHEAASGDLTDYGHLHQVRIAGKRLRYAMEVFADCFGPPFRDQLYPAVEEMQEILGRANDSHVAAQKLKQLREPLRRAGSDVWRRLKPGIEGLLRAHQRRLPKERQRFLAWWSGWRRFGAEAALTRLLHPSIALPR
jgi:CHAD domain-containing protein